MSGNDLMGDRARRIGLNESVFREVNEQLEQIADDFGLHDADLDLICECGRVECGERIRVSRADYERIRSDPLLFFIVPGHELQDVETVVERTKRYHVVHKFGEAAERVAEQSNPRSR